MSFVKNKLKAAREAIGKKDFSAARDSSAQALEYEPDNYNANVFYGLALLELGQKQESEQAYRKAIESNPDLPLAWQGIAKLYEQTEAWDKYAGALDSLMKLFAKADDATKCAENLQKFVDIRRQRSSRPLFADALSLYLPQSALYPVLSNLPPPDPTNPTSSTTFQAQLAIHDGLPIIQEIVSLYETEEEEIFSQEVEKRRQRLGAPSPDVIRKEVGQDVWGKSRLPEYYNEILNHPNTSDILRRETESKLFLHKQRYLYVLPESAETKRAVADELDDLVNGIVLLGIPDELAWIFYLEGQDFYSIESYNFTNLQKFIQLFPASALSRMLKGYFKYVSIPILDEDNPDPDREEDPFDMMLDAFNSLQNSILSHRILANIYSVELDYESCIKVAESGLELVRRAEADRGRKLSQTNQALNVALGTSLVHYYPPKNHSRALRILDDVISQDPDNVPSLMGRAFILQYSNRWAEAGLLFSKVQHLMPGNMDEGIRAQEENAWCLAQQGDIEAAISELQHVQAALDEIDGRGTDQARCWWRLGKCLWDLGDDTKEEAFKHFITSLKRSPSFAPAFTSLGTYYTESGDPNRASKCFQKAFELDAREVEAARKLAAGFAEEREWDLVEVVARRTIEGEGGGQAVAAARFLPVNAWAWKAVGVVELNRRNYPAAINSFQVSLRGEPDDQLSWLRLGEAYGKAGRHAAAVKALDKARELRPDDWICLFLIGEVQCQTGQFKEAIETFKAVLKNQPSELGVLQSLSNAYLELGCNEAGTGFTSRAESSFSSSIETALKAMETSPGFRRVAWKAVADSIYNLSDIVEFKEQLHTQGILSRVRNMITVSDRVSKILTLKEGASALELALAAYDYRISLGFHDDKARGSAWFDLGIALQAWEKKHEAHDSHKAAAEEAIRCLKEAIVADPGNELYWVALGDLYFQNNAKSAQHAYVKALEINSKNVETWTNLGLLYLHHEDLELANQAFYRAQTLDPDYALAWVGQGLVATANNHDTDAENLFEHAVGLSVPSLHADVEYASRLFSHLASTIHSQNKPSSSLLPAFFVLDRFCSRQPKEASALHLFGLVCERVGHYDLAIDIIERTISILEAAYEENEDPVIERQFTIANTNVARLQLATGNYQGAIEFFESALGLLGDDEGDVSSALRTQCHFGSGIAHFKLGALDDALVSLETALESAGENLKMRGHVTVLLAQTLWALGTEEGRESAKSQLLQCIASDPENLEAINALVGMGILTSDDSLVDAALSEILSLPLHKRHEMDPRRDVVNLLVKQHLGQGDSAAALSEAQKAIFLEPASGVLRRNAASLALQGDHQASALAILSQDSAVLRDASETSKSLGLRAVAECLAGQNGVQKALKLVQKAVVISPGDIDAWKILAFVRSYEQL